MLSSLDIAKYFLHKAYAADANADITNMKVQKLLYYSQCLHLAMFQAVLFEDEIQAWKHGPVCPMAYHYFRNLENNKQFLPRIGDLSKITSEVQALLSQVWDHFGCHSALVLRNMTHSEFPWNNARKGLSPCDSSQEVISLEDLRQLGELKLDEIERSNPLFEELIENLVFHGITASREQQGNVIEQGDTERWLLSLLD